jgi:hypothetical protein
MLVCAASGADLDLFKNLAVLSQVPLNLPHMAANSLFFGKLFGN